MSVSMSSNGKPLYVFYIYGHMYILDNLYIPNQGITAGVGSYPSQYPTFPYYWLLIWDISTKIKSLKST